MLPKYMLTDEWLTVDGARVYRIRALRDFGDVDAGELGGWVESEHNLSHDGHCWVAGDAVVRGDACVRGNAWVLGNARIYGSACVSEEARVSGYTRISGNARVYGRAQVFGGTWTTSPTQIQGSRDFLTHSFPGYITIGCQVHSIPHWLSEARNIGKEHGYTDAEIEEYLSYIRKVSLESRANT